MMIANELILLFINLDPSDWFFITQYAILSIIHRQLRYTLRSCMTSNIRHEDFRLSSSSSSITLRVPLTLDFEMGWNGELWWNTNLLTWQNYKNKTFFLLKKIINFFSSLFFLFLVRFFIFFFFFFFWLLTFLEIFLKDF